MSEHYFSNKPQSKSMPQVWNYHLRDIPYTFTTDVGVFSRKEVDFGSVLLIEQFEEPNVEGSILDLGCGYGPIGISIADRYKNRNVVMVDVNERAIMLAKQNAILNEIQQVEIMQSNIFSAIKGRKFASVVTNPPIRAGKKIVHKMFEESQESLVDNGELWVVIQKKQGAPSAKKKLESLFGRVDTVAKSKGYYILRAVKG